MSFKISGLIAQSNPYPEGDIILKINDSFGISSDWINLSTTNEFRHDACYNEPASFAIGANGDIYLVNNIKDELQLFDNEGKFIKTLAKITKITKFHAVRMVGILDNKYIITENYNRLHIFNLNGTLFKILYLDYPTYQVVSLKENKLAIYAHILLGGSKNKYSIILKDIITEQEKVIESTIEESEKYTYSLVMDKGVMSCFFPYSRSAYYLNKINNDRLLVGYNYKQALNIYNYKGELVSTFNMNIAPLKVEDTVKKEFQEKIKNKIYQMGYKEQFDKNPINDKLFPEYLPFFHSIQVDDKNNILIFLYTEGKPEYKVSIYSISSGNGKYMGTSTFNSDKYALNVNSSSMQMHFGNKEIQAIIRDGGDKKSSFKLVKFTY